MRLKFVLVGFRHDEERSKCYRKGYITDERGYPDLFQIIAAFREAVGNQSDIISVRIIPEKEGDLKP